MGGQHFKTKKLSSIEQSLKHGISGLVGYETGLDGAAGCIGQGSQGSGSLALCPLECGAWKWPEAELAMVSPCQDRHPVCSAVS